MKILNIVENLDKGAVENWLVNVFIESKKNRPEWEWSFYCILGKPGRLDEKVKRAGGKIIYSPCSISNKLKFIKALRNTLKAGRFDILHSHHDFLSGFYLPATMGIKFKKRILHIHNTDEALPVGSRRLEKTLRKPLGNIAVRFSDVIVGISQDTLKKFTGTINTGRKKKVVLYYGIDMERFNETPVSLGSELGLPPTAKLVLFAGRMNPYKNPVFVVDILNELLKKDNNYYALFVGEGDLLKEVKEKAALYNIASHIKYLGWSENLPAVMKQCDVFVFPRLEEPKEGLGIVVVEAQAAGLPMVLSNGIVQDAVEIPELVAFIPLKNNAAEWAEKILSFKKTITQQQALDKMKQSKFALPMATANLIKLYEN